MTAAETDKRTDRVTESRLWSSPPTCQCPGTPRVPGGAMLSLVMLALIGFATVTTATEISHDPNSAVQADGHNDGDDHATGGHTDPFSFVLIELALVVV